MAEKVLFSYVSKEDEDGISIEINKDDDFFTWDAAQPNCDCMMMFHPPFDFSADLHFDPTLMKRKEPNPRKTLSWLKSMYEDLYGEGDTD